MQTPLTFFIAFVAVLVLIGIVAWLVRRFAGNRLGGSANRGRMPRLAVIDAAAVDGRRRLVLVRRDNVEHLLMIGGPTDIVVEPNIVRAMPSRDQMSPRPGLGGETRGVPPSETANWAEESPRLDTPPEPALPPPVTPSRPARPSFADELRRPRHLRCRNTGTTRWLRSLPNRCSVRSLVPTCAPNHRCRAPIPGPNRRYRAPAPAAAVKRTAHRKGSPGSWSGADACRSAVAASATSLIGRPEPCRDGQAARSRVAPARRRSPKHARTVGI